MYREEWKQKDTNKHVSACEDPSSRHGAPLVDFEARVKVVEYLFHPGPRRRGVDYQTPKEKEVIP